MLIETLFRDVTVSQELHGLLGEARGRTQAALVLIDAPDPVPRALPWELLGLGEPLEAAGAAIIARITHGPITRLSAEAFAHGLYGALQVPLARFQVEVA